MVLFPNCKINIGLDVLSKREDGFHNLKTAFIPVLWTDVLEILPSNVLSFESSGLTIPGNIQDNLCLKAYHLLKNEFHLPPVQIYLQKNLPMGGGLGGGSSNAAFMLMGLNQLFELKLSQEQLMKFSIKLGSDCPFFIKNTPCIAEGRGEILTDFNLDFDGLYIKLINIGIHVSTKEAFSGLTPKNDPSGYDEISNINRLTWNKLVKNDFEQTVFEQHKELLNTKQNLLNEGAFYASMTGTGSTIYGLFENKPFSNGKINGFEKIIKLGKQE
jgi:4-diphosphocytidyl-2-C-methyl-D-erythritol kinase